MLENLRAFLGCVLRSVFLGVLFAWLPSGVFASAVTQLLELDYHDSARLGYTLWGCGALFIAAVLMAAFREEAIAYAKRN